MNKKIPLLALGALVLGAGASIAVQSFAQTSAIATPVAIDQTIDQKDIQGNDIEADDDQESVVTTAVVITEDQARQAALAANPGTTVSSVDLEEHHGVAQYEVTLDTKLEIKIDATTGTITKSEKSESDEDSGDAKDAQGNDIETND